MSCHECPVVSSVEFSSVVYCMSLYIMYCIVVCISNRVIISKVFM